MMAPLSREPLPQSSLGMRARAGLAAVAHQIGRAVVADWRGGRRQREHQA